MVQEGKTEGWGQLLKLPENKRKEGLGFYDSKSGLVKSTRGTFPTDGFINAPSRQMQLLKTSLRK